MAIADLPRFDTIAEAVDCSIENGVSVLNTGLSPNEIQLAYQGFSNCGFNRLGPVTSEVAGIIMPTLAEIVDGSFFQQYSSMQGRRTNAGDYFPGQLLFLRQELEGVEPTVHSSIIKENPSDKPASRDRILLSADYKVSTKN